MRILHVASELYPFVKTGGLGDVVAALPPALARRGADVRLLLPGYPTLRREIEHQEPAETRGGQSARGVTLRRGRVPGSGIPVYLIDAPGMFDRPGNPYLGIDDRDWPDNHLRFALLGRMAAHLASGLGDAEWCPNIVHAHDWHAGLTPAYIRAEEIAGVATLFTIHNLAFQGLFPEDLFQALDLPPSFFSIEGLEFYGKISFMKAGIRFADRITSVSPTYAGEIQTPEFGFGLEGLLWARRDAISGILNGVDCSIWNPAADPALPRPFGPEDMTGKSEAKLAIQRAFGLTAGPERLLFGAVTRLTEQKGFDLVLEALPEIVRHGGQLVLLGSGDEMLEAEFRAAAERFPGSVGVRIGFDETLAHAIIGGADMVLVPSRFEPCGLTQLYAMRYGALPLAHRVGGLADTVVDADEEALRNDRATGIVFDQPTPVAFAGAIRRGFALFGRREAWGRVQRRAMAADFSWETAAGQYIDLYRGMLPGAGTQSGTG